MMPWIEDIDQNSAPEKASFIKRLVSAFTDTLPCKHEFLLSDLKKTGIAPLAKPESNDSRAWFDYYQKVYEHESVTKRVVWPCRKCRKEFFAHCGLDISPKYGPTVGR